jgi:transposase
MPKGKATPLVLTATERAELERLVRRRKTAQDLALRARIVLRCAGGATNQAVAGEVGVCAHTVGKWRERFAKDRLDGLRDEPRSGAPRTVTDEQRVAELLVRTLEATPANATHWSTRSMAAACGLSPATGQRVWRAFGLKPHRVETFKLSADPVGGGAANHRQGARHRRALPRPAGPGLGPVRRREDRNPGGRAHPAGAADAARPAGAAHLGLHPPRHVLAVRGLGRGGGPGHRPLLPAAPGGGVPRFPRRGGRGRARGPRGARGPGQRLDPPGAADPGVAARAAPLPAPLHADGELVAEPGRAVLRRADRPPRRLKRGVHRSVEELEAAVLAYVERHNAEPRPFRWTRSADQILAGVGRACERTLAVHGSELQRT